MGQEGPWTFIRCIISHDGNLCILNSALEEEIPAIWISYLFSATDLRKIMSTLCLVGSLAQKNLKGYWASKYLGQEEDEKWVSCRQAISICYFLRILKDFTFF